METGVSVVPTILCFPQEYMPDTCPTGSLVGSTCEAQEHWSYLSSAEGCSLTLVQAAGRSEWPSRLALADIRQGQNW